VGDTGRERRRHERHDVEVRISMIHGGDSSVLRASNISAGGLKIDLGPRDMVSVDVGTVVRVHLDLGADKYGRPLDVECDAEIVRVDLGGPDRQAGFALMWTSTDAAVARQLAVILEYLAEE
jgi:hypothetical protein